MNTLPNGQRMTPIQAREKIKPHIRAQVKHVFHALKNLSGHRKAHHKDLAKNTAQLSSLFGLVNLALAKRKLLNLQGTSAP